MPSEPLNMPAPLISPGGLLAVYCILVLLASLAGGWLLLAIHLTHTRLQMAVSFVAGLMLGIALLHFLPDAAEQLHSLDRTVNWLLAGFLVMFFVQRFFHFHHHDLPEGDPEDCCRDTIMPTRTITANMPTRSRTNPPNNFLGWHGARPDAALAARRTGAGCGRRRRGARTRAAGGPRRRARRDSP